MKICFVLNHFLPEQTAGTEIYVKALAENLIRQGKECFVLIPNYGKDKAEEYFIDTVRVIKYPETSIADRTLIMGKKAPEGLKHFLEILAAENPDAVHFHGIAGSNGITVRHIFSAKAAGFATLMTFHLAGHSCMTGNLMYKDQQLCDGVIRIKRCAECFLYVTKGNAAARLLTTPGMLLHKLGVNTTSLNSSAGTALGFPFIIEKLKKELQLIEKNCDKLVALTHWYREILIKNNISENKISLITQALPKESKANLTDSPSDKKDCLRIIFIGRISRFKGVHLLIGALKEVKGNVRLDIYGQENDSEYSDECRALAEGMNNISWKGLLSPECVVETIHRYDLLCLPSTFSEMSPLVIQEAYAAGVPVLASDVYGNAEQIKDGVSGWLFKFKDSGDLSKCLQRLADNPGLIKAAKLNILPVKSFQAVAEEHAALYSSILLNQDYKN